VFEKNKTMAMHHLLLCGCGFAEKKKATIAAIAFFCGGSCREEEGEGSYRCFLLWPML
jgi:hypothetical protein